MIGVIAESAEQNVVREFFELFKTPWEFYRADRRYDVLLCAGDCPFGRNAGLIVLYAGSKIRFDEQQNIRTGRQQRRAIIGSYRGNRLPIYGDTITFPVRESTVLTDEDSGQCVAYTDQSGEQGLARIGYDLFEEVRELLTAGQPPANAQIPALELHISLLRDLIIGRGIPLIEIPPVPDGYQCIVCLTHDVDHPSIRQHKWDHTTFGFLYRAVIGSLHNLIRGRISIGDVVTNWRAALSLPFIHLGLAKDFWREFDDRYIRLENGVSSTFFVIPFKSQPGNNGRDSAPKFRAAQYGAQDIADTIRTVVSVGCEVGLHGIDAWLDSSKGREELEEIQRLTGAADIGVRMHWLYYDQESPLVLEEAGAAYDSTIGYNETVGYRAGTTQVYKPLDARFLLELPLHVMDTALFYPAHLGLSQRQARTLLDHMADNAVQFGGCLTINWHDRSVAPERLWDGCYRDLVEDLRSRGAWFCTAGQAVSWFRKRRSVVFETDGMEPDTVHATVEADQFENLPGLRLRIHRAQTSSFKGAYGPDYSDVGFDESVDISATCTA